MSEPLVSIYITSYNQNEFIEDAIVSAVEQDYDNLEVVVSDDASTDGSQEIIREMAKKYPDRLRVSLQEENKGITENHNRALMECQGELISNLDGDDILLPGKIRKQVEFMSDHNECNLVHHNTEVFDTYTGKVLYDWKDRFGAISGKVDNLVKYGNALCSVSVMVRRQAIPKDGFDNRMYMGADWYLWIQVAAKDGGKIGYIDEVLARYRRHNKNVTLNWTSKIENQFVTLALVETHYPDFISAVRRRRADLFLMLAVRQASKGYYRNALRSWLECNILTFPFLWRSFRLPLRELAFYVRSGRNLDDLAKSLISNK